MATRSKTDGLDLDSVESRLRLKFRCTMCQKRCRVPCQFTADEFQEMVDASFEEQTMTTAADV